jgi:hypothetical protein
MQTVLSSKTSVRLYRTTRRHVSEKSNCFVTCLRASDFSSLKRFLQIFGNTLKSLNVSLCLTNYALRHESLWGSGSMDPRFLDSGTRWRWVVSFRRLPPPPLSQPHLTSPHLTSPHSRSEQFGEVKILYPTETRIPTPRSSSPQPVAIPTELLRLVISKYGKV